MRRTIVIGLVIACCVLGASRAHAQSSIESPASGSNLSGLGDIHGWKCTAGNLTFTIDNGPLGQLIYGANRGDTQGICGDVNNGFITQYNWNLIGSGQHTIRVFDNSQQFAQATFTVVTLGVEFLTGASSTTTAVINGKNVTLTWQQNQQNYAITGVGGGGGSYPNVAGSWSVSLDFVTETCNFIQIPPDLPTHLSGSLQVAQVGANLTITQGSQTLTGDIKTDGHFTVVSTPDINTAAGCTYGLVAGYDGNFLNNTTVFLLLADRISGNCAGVSLPCLIGYEGSLVKISAQSSLSQEKETSPADALRAIIGAMQQQAE